MLKLTKTINFLYGTLLITVVGAGIVFWILSKIDQSYPEITATNTTPSSVSDWQGHWILVGSDQFSGSDMTVSSLTKTGFTFDISSSDGGDSGEWTNYQVNQSTGKNEIVGTMSIEGDVAHYTDDPTNAFKDINAGKPCTGTFTLSNDGVSLFVKTNCDQYYAGNGVYFDGTYRKDVKTLDTADLRQLYAFKANPQSYSVFTSLVGNTLKTFNNNDMQEDQIDDLDGFGASVSGIAVAHLYTENESIIMVAPNNQIWAATIDWDAQNNQKVDYFTNVPAWKNKLPKTIKAWMANFNEYPVVYENK
jgi:hypothetical protein